MTYNAPTAKAFREKKGSGSEKITTELTLIDTEIKAIVAGEALQQSDFVVLTAGIGVPAALATAGVDMASGSDIFVYGSFVAPVNITVSKLHYYLTEAYVKDTTDAKVELYDDASSPVKIFGGTLTASGMAAKTFTSLSPESGKADIAAGTRLDLKAVNTGSSTGTGHAVVILEYIER